MATPIRNIYKDDLFIAAPKSATNDAVTFLIHVESRTTLEIKVSVYAFDNNSFEESYEVEGEDRLFTLTRDNTNMMSFEENFGGTFFSAFEFLSFVNAQRVALYVADKILDIEIKNANPFDSDEWDERTRISIRDYKVDSVFNKLASPLALDDVGNVDSQKLEDLEGLSLSYLLKLRNTFNAE